MEFKKLYNLLQETPDSMNGFDHWDDGAVTFIIGKSFQLWGSNTPLQGLTHYKLMNTLSKTAEKLGTMQFPMDYPPVTLTEENYPPIYMHGNFQGIANSLSNSRNKILELSRAKKQEGILVGRYWKTANGVSFWNTIQSLSPVAINVLEKFFKQAIKLDASYMNLEFFVEPESGKFDPFYNTNTQEYSWDQFKAEVHKNNSKKEVTPSDRIKAAQQQMHTMLPNVKGMFNKAMNKNFNAQPKRDIRDRFAMGESHSFKDYFEVVKEMDERHLAHISPDAMKILGKKKLPFEHIFGDKLRIAEPLSGGKEYEDKIGKHIVDYDLDFPSWTGTKKTDKTKKNPVKMGKILNKRKEQLASFLKTPNQPESAIETWKQQIAEIDEILKTTDIQKQWQNKQKTSFVVIYSRAPIDVLRMGDFKWRVPSCHAPPERRKKDRGTADFFHCAIAEAMWNSGVIYLLREDDYNKLTENDSLQAEEIFEDEDRDIEGILPVARMRIRAAIDAKGNTLAVPTTKIYAIKDQELNDAFKAQAIKWAKRQDVNDFEWNNTLTMPGGSYEDTGYDLKSMIKQIWGKNIEYIIDRRDQNTVPPDEDDDNDGVRDQEDEWAHEEEHFMDEFRESISDDKIADNLFEDDNYTEHLSCSVNYRSGNDYGINFVLPRPINEALAKNDYVNDMIIKGVHNRPMGKNATVIVHNGTHAVNKRYSIQLEGDYIALDDFVEYRGGYPHNLSNINGLHEEAAEGLLTAIENFTGKSYSIPLSVEDSIEMKWDIFNRILEVCEEPTIDTSLLHEIADKYLNKAVPISEIVPLPDVSQMSLSDTNENMNWDWFLFGVPGSGSTSRSIQAEYIINRFSDLMYKKMDNTIAPALKKWDISPEDSQIIMAVYGHFHIPPSTRGIAVRAHAKLISSRAPYNFPASRQKYLGQLSDDPEFGFSLYLETDTLDDIVFAGELPKLAKLINDVFEDDDYINIDSVEEAINQFVERESQTLEGQKELDLSSFKRFFLNRQ